MNRLSAIRWLGAKIGKPNLGYDRNQVFGLRGQSPGNTSKTAKLTVSITRHVDDPYIRVSLKLQAAFGLRRSEAMKIQPRWADRGDKLVLKGSWTKGGRSREIPLCTAYQRGVLEEAKRIAKSGSLIPPHKSYRQHLHTWEHLTRGASLSKTHGLRHAYAQARYRALTGWPSPHAGGPARAALRESWISGLKWEWERRIPQAGPDVFLFELPDSKNGLPMYAFCNSVAREVVNRQRGRHPQYVFVHEDHRISKMNNTAWKTARRKAGLENVFGPTRSKMPRHFRVHDLRVTCSTWLREAGVSREDRQAVLNHYNGDITTHYSVAEIGYMLEQVEKLVTLVHKPSFYLVRAETKGPNTGQLETDAAG